MLIHNFVENAQLLGKTCAIQYSIHAEPDDIGFDGDDPEDEEKFKSGVLASYLITVKAQFLSLESHENLGGVWINTHEKMLPQVMQIVHDECMLLEACIDLESQILDVKRTFP